MVSNKLAIIIPTKDRPEELRRLLKSIFDQETKPNQIVLVDGGDVSAEKISGEFPSLKVDYMRKVPASLTAQRNAGIKVLSSDITLVGFLDDDVVLEKGSLENMMKFWENTAPDTGGAAFNITNVIYKRPTFFEKLFLVNAELPSMILPSGFQSKVSYVDKTTAVQWLPGCSMIWRREVFDHFIFDEWFSGYARYEEVDFSYRVGRRYKMFIVSDAKVKHLSRMEDVSFSFPLGKMEVVNRFYFVKKNPALSVILCSWALMGLLFNNITKGILRRDKRCLYRARGNLAGFAHLLGKGLR